ncbi:acyltransferase, partial [Pseudoalteromonas fuliginea]
IYIIKFKKFDDNRHTIHLKYNTAIYYPEKINHKGYIHFNDSNFIDARGGLDLGVNVILAPRVCILTYNHDHTNSDWLPYSPEIIRKKVVVGDNTWIGFDSLILPGSHVGKNCVIGAKSVLKGLYPDNSLIVGNPAKVVKTLNKTDNAKAYLLEKYDGVL